MLVPAGVIGLYLAATLGPTALLSEERVLGHAESVYRDAMRAPARSLASHQLFGRAAEWLEILRKRGANNPDLYVNLAQAYLLAEDIPRSIMASRQGLGLAPAHPVLHALLEEGRDQVDYPTYGAFAKPPAYDWPPWLPRLSPSARLAIAFLSYVAACVAFTRWRMAHRGKWLGVSITALVLVVLLGAGLVSEYGRLSWEKAHPLAVVSSDAMVVLHKGNGSKYPCYNATAKKWEDAGDGVPPGATPLKPGVEAHVRFDKGDWLQIELTSGEVGWVRRREVLVDEQMAR